MASQDEHNSKWAKKLLKKNENCIINKQEAPDLCYPRNDANRSPFVERLLKYRAQRGSTTCIPSPKDPCVITADFIAPSAEIRTEYVAETTKVLENKSYRLYCSVASKDEYIPSDDDYVDIVAGRYTVEQYPRLKDRETKYDSETSSVLDAWYGNDKCVTVEKGTFQAIVSNNISSEEEAAKQAELDEAAKLLAENMLDCSISNMEFSASCPDTFIFNKVPSKRKPLSDENGFNYSSTVTLPQDTYTNRLSDLESNESSEFPWQDVAKNIMARNILEWTSSSLECAYGNLSATASCAVNIAQHNNNGQEVLSVIDTIVPVGYALDILRLNASTGKWEGIGPVIAAGTNTYTLDVRELDWKLDDTTGEVILDPATYGETYSFTPQESEILNPTSDHKVVFLVGEENLEYVSPNNSTMQIWRGVNKLADYNSNPRPVGTKRVTIAANTFYGTLIYQNPYLLTQDCAFYENFVKNIGSYRSFFGDVDLNAADYRDANTDCEPISGTLEQQISQFDNSALTLAESSLTCVFANDYYGENCATGLVLEPKQCYACNDSTQDTDPNTDPNTDQDTDQDTDLCKDSCIKEGTFTSFEGIQDATQQAKNVVQNALSGCMAMNATVKAFCDKYTMEQVMIEDKTFGLAVTFTFNEVEDAVEDEDKKQEILNALRDNGTKIVYMYLNDWRDYTPSGDLHYATVECSQVVSINSEGEEFIESTTNISHCLSVMDGYMYEVNQGTYTSFQENATVAEMTYQAMILAKSAVVCLYGNRHQDSIPCIYTPLNGTTEELCRGDCSDTGAAANCCVYGEPGIASAENTYLAENPWAADQQAYTASMATRLCLAQDQVGGGGGGNTYNVNVAGECNDCQSVCVFL